MVVGVLSAAAAVFLLSRFFAYVWDLLPIAASRPVGAIAIGLFVITAGWWFFRLRETHRTAYAALELGAALGTSVEASLRLGGQSNRGALMLTLFGCIYIAVRAYDNFAKAAEERRASADLEKRIAMAFNAGAGAPATKGEPLPPPSPSPPP